MKKSRTLWVLTILFAGAALKSAGSLYSAEDYALLASVSMGVTIVSYGFDVLVLIGEAATAFLLFKQKTTGYVVGSYLALAEVLNGLFGLAIMLSNPEKAKAAYVAHRAAMGVTPSQQDVESLTSIQSIGLMALAYIGLWALIYYYLRRVKPELSR